MNNNFQSFFKVHSWLNWIIGDPLQTEKVSIIIPLAAIAIIYTAYSIYLLLKKKTNTANSERMYEFFSAPLKSSMKLSALLLQDAVRAHYQKSLKELFIKNGLNIVGAIIISVCIYCLAIVIAILSRGIHIIIFQELWLGDWNTRIGILLKFLTTNVYANTALLTIYIFSVIAYAKNIFLEKKYWNQRRSGVLFALPIGEWDETPKLNIPEAELIAGANDSIQQLLGDKGVNYIRVKLASGYDTLGPGGHLLELLKRPHIRWHILLCNPKSAGAKKRAAAYLSARASDPPPLSCEGDYLQSIENTIASLKKIKDDHNNNISVKVYDHTPQWRIFLFNTTAIINAFGPGQRSDRAPMIILENSSTSMYHGFEEMFEEIWKNDSTLIF